MYEAIGWVGSFLFSICAIPQAWKCYQEKNGHGLSWTFLLTWFFGELLTTVYVWPKQDWPLLVNYMVNFSCLLVIIFYKIRGRS